VAAYLLFAAYFLIGVFGRFPWKADEPYSFGIVWNMLSRGQWLVPYVGGDPFLEKPPLMFWLGALFAKALPDMVPYESSRLAVVLCIAITASSLLWAADGLYGERFHRRRGSTSDGPSLPNWRLSALALLVGTVGLAEHVHKFTADLGQLAGASLAMSALAVAAARQSEPALRDARPLLYERFAPGKTSPLMTGLLFGVGTGMAFLSKGLLVVGIAGLTWLLCLMMLTAFRREAGLTFSLAALLAALPFLLPWPLALYFHAPGLFDQWFWVNNIGRFAGSTTLGGHDNPLGDRLLAVITGGAPMSWLLLASLLRLKWRPQWRYWSVLPRRYPGYAAVLIFLLVGLLALVSSAAMRDIYLLPLYPAMVLAALPATALFDRLGSFGRRVLNSFFAVLLLLVLMTWATLCHVGEPVVLQWIWPRAASYFPVPFDLPASGGRLLITMVLLVLWWRAVRIRGAGGVLLTWSCGLATVWCSAFLLLMPWFDSARSYQSTFAGLAPLVQQGNCLATDGLGESELGLLHYVTGRAGHRIYAGWSGEGDGRTINPASVGCDLFLVQDDRRDPQKYPPAGWREIWRGNRPADDNGFILYRRIAERR
jgi:4-amino-4-deoxy-L-arabinose transferase-like glycosyltransferase